MRFADRRKAIVVIVGSVLVTGGLLALILSLGSWAYHTRRFLLHERRLAPLLEKHATVTDISSALLAEPGNREFAVPPLEEDFVALVGQWRGGREPPAGTAYMRRCPILRRSPMSMNVGGGRGGAISTINVTPMADVIIVLLIIFMVTIPVISRGQVDLPDATQARSRADGRIVVTVSANGSITLSDHGVIAPFELSMRLRERLGVSDAVVQVNADQALSYERVAEVLAACREAGADEVVVMTDSPREWSSRS